MMITRRKLLTAKEKKARAKLAVVKAKDKRQRDRLDFVHMRKTFASIADIRMELEYELREDAA